MIKIDKKKFGVLGDKEIYKYEISNEKGFQVNILNYGGIITEIFVKDKDGIRRNIVLRYKEFDKYVLNSAYPGAVVGRTAGRIENGEITINGIKYELDKNNKNGSIHGGKEGLSFKVFDVKELENGIELSYNSPHLENGYPGNVVFKVRYFILETFFDEILNKENNEKDNTDIFIIEYEAISDKDTYINLTNHSYFNLSGERENGYFEENGDKQILIIKADSFCELDLNMIPTGEFLDVSDYGNTIFDLRKGKIIEEGIKQGQNDKNSQFKITRAYDHPFKLNWNKIDHSNPQITLFSRYSKIKMDVFTMENSAVIYTGNYLDDNGFNRYGGVAIETQDFPNGINNTKLKGKILKKDEKYLSKTIFKFSV